MEQLVVYPLVLLSVVGHSNRVGKIVSSQHVVEVLFDLLTSKILDASNSRTGKTFIYTILFITLFYFRRYSMKQIKKNKFDVVDREYLGNMYGMLRKINSTE